MLNGTWEEGMHAHNILFPVYGVCSVHVFCHFLELLHMMVNKVLFHCLLTYVCIPVLLVSIKIRLHAECVAGSNVQEFDCQALSNLAKEGVCFLSV